jgi:hypothetical protein
MNTKKAVVLGVVAALAIGSGVAWSTRADAHGSHGYRVQDIAGNWAGVASGTFLDAPFAASYVLNIDSDGEALFTLDSTVGRVTADCTVTVEANGFGNAHCVDTSGPTAGAESDNRFVITRDKKQLAGWTSIPAYGYFTTTTAERQ